VITAPVRLTEYSSGCGCKLPQSAGLDADRLLLADAQTSDGLLFAVAQADSEPLLTALHAAGDCDAVVVGELVDSGRPGRVTAMRRGG